MNLPVVIVGGGTAGSTVALQLASQTSRPIVVCEPGDISPWDDEARFFTVLDDARLTRTESVTVMGRTIDYRQAKVMGGGSAINGMLLTGDEPSYVHGLTMLPRNEHMGDVSRALLKAGGRPCRLWWNNGRWNPGRALLHLVEEGRVEWKQAPVTRVVHDEGAVTAVELGDEVIQTDCVVLTAGAIASPRLLMVSNFDSICSGIGDNVQDHPSISFSLKRLTANKGLFDATVVCDLLGPNDSLGLMVAYERRSRTDDATALVSVMLMNPDSRGVMRKNRSHVEIDSGLLTTSRDKEALRDLVRQAINILNNQSFDDVATNIVGGESAVSLADLSTFSDSELDEWVQCEVLPVSHVSSTLSRCVDERGRLRGVSGMVVADASVLPSVPHETPAAAVTIEARRIGQLLGEALV